MATIVPYTKQDDYLDGKKVDETSSATAVSLEDEFQEVEDRFGAMPALTDSGNSLTLLNGIDFDGNFAKGIDNFNNAVFTPTSTARAAVVTAIQAAVTNGGGIVFFPPDTYTIDSAITTSDISGTLRNVAFVGVGRSSILEYGHTSAGDMFDFGGNEKIQFYNLEFQYGAGATASGRYIDNVGSYFVGKNLSFGGGTNMDGAIAWATGQTNVDARLDHIFWSGEADNRIISCTRLRGAKFSSIDITASGGTPLAGLWFSATGGNNEDVTVDGFRYNGGAGTGSGLEVDGASTGRITVSNIQIENAVASSAIKLGTSASTGADNVVLNGGVILANHANGNGIDASETTDCIIANLVVTGIGATSDGDGVLIDGSERLRVADCTLEGFDAAAGRAINDNGVASNGFIGCGNTITNCSGATGTLITNQAEIGAATNALFTATINNVY